MIYRALRTLEMGKHTVDAGDIFPSRWITPQAAEILIEAGKLSEANLPPMAAIPQFRDLAGRLNGYANTDVFLETDTKELSAYLEMSAKEVDEIKQQLYKIFSSARPKDG